MTIYTVKGSTVYVGSELDTEVFKSLPINTYVVSFTPMTGFFLTVGTDFELPSKLYGDTMQKAERFLNTFADRPGTTGVLLSGAKGSGKSLVMKVTSILGLARGIPTLIVSSNYCGENFNQFVQSIDQECIMIFDEFEKIYDEEHQEQLLTLFDGTFTSKKLVIATCNDPYRIDSHMTNRPGRMYYYLKYTGVTEAFIREYCADRLTDLSKTQAICTLSAMFKEFNFDMLKALVEELNRYPTESVKEAVSILNINHDQNIHHHYDITVQTSDGLVLPITMFSPNVVRNPIQEDVIEISIYGKNRKDPAPVRKTRGYKKVITQEPDYDDVEDECYDDGLESDENIKVVREITIPMQTGQLKISGDLSRIQAQDGDLTIVFTKQVYKAFDYLSLI